MVAAGKTGAPLSDDSLPGTAKRKLLTLFRWVFLFKKAEDFAYEPDHRSAFSPYRRFDRPPAANDELTVPSRGASGPSLGWSAYSLSLRFVGNAQPTRRVDGNWISLRRTNGGQWQLQANKRNSGKAYIGGLFQLIAEICERL
jgi:hypothetical protein